jgi:20S proteasome alpha/beta subunit
MTLILALKCVGPGENAQGDSILVCSDSKAVTYPGVALRTQKIHAIVTNPRTKQEMDLALAAGAGNMAMVRHAIRLAEKEMTNSLGNEWKGDYPSHTQFESVVERVENRIMSKIAEWRERGLEPDLNIILCGLDPEGKASIFVFDNLGMANPTHDTGYACIGRGFVTGGNMILQQFWDPAINVDWAQMLAAYTIEMVSKVDTTVGSFEGASWYFRIQGKKPVFGEMKFESLKPYLDRVRKREEALKLAWDKCDLLEEDRVLKLLKDASENEK